MPTNPSRYSFAVFREHGSTKLKKGLATAFLAVRSIHKGATYLLERNEQWTLLWDWKRYERRPLLGEYLVSFQLFKDGERIAVARPLVPAERRGKGKR